MGDQWLIGETLEGLGHVAMSIRKYKLARTRLAESLLVYRPLGDLRVARSLEGLARIAAQRGAPAHAFRLAGAAARLRETWGYPPSAHEERVLHGWIDAARRVLGSTIAESERNAGRQLSMDQAVDMAMAAVSTPGKDAATDSSAPHLTPREAEVLRHVARGDSNQEIAAALVISVNTVEHHIASLYGKIGARRRADAVAYAFTGGMA
jgi:non-specific serine/threonine protein kinase